MANKNKIILDLCGGTGAWSKPWKDAGYTVHVITLPSYDILNTRFDEKVFWFMPTNGGHVLHVPIKQVVGILAAPPCTMFSRARTTAKTPRDFKNAMKLVSMCFEIIWKCRSAGSLKFWVLENPVGLLRQFIGNPPHSFHGWEYGDKHVKFTDLFGYYSMPAKKIKIQPVEFSRKKWGSPKKPKEYSGLKLTRADIRAITPPRFARAFYNANKI